MKPAVVLFTLLLLTPLAGLTASPATAKPNILILYADDMGYGDFPGGPLDHGFDHYFGDNVIKLPNK